MGYRSMASLSSCARKHRVESGVGAWYGHSPLLVSVGLSSSLGLLPMKTHSSNQEMKSN